VLHEGAVVGEISSGTLSPTLQRGIGLAYLPAAAAAVGTALEIDVRGRRYPAVVEKKPFAKGTSVKKK
jgi:aminomethyltransferase